MKLLVTMCCMLGVAFYSMFASAANDLMSAAPAEGVLITSELTGSTELKSRLPTIARPDRRKLVQREPQGRLEIAQSAPPPTIAALSPASGPIGTLVMIQGSNFTYSDNLIRFRGALHSFAAGPVGSEDGTSLQFQVNTCPSREPQCPGFMPAPGPYKVTVNNANGVSNEATFTLTLR